ncbi:TetR/AcrR family transcriptional regulator [Propionibacterium australiense]|uniref:Homeobox domain-like n=1 Tax=Propionibacterium australiense TaxID=119981 RepID=A0A383S4R2_9ACTN|nr:helix-turn-helix domain-containing protein [Propionibacterium australiense]RLP10083.1 TetR family transcriptional regulator [Propionibacterium australiense]RLP11366.1 TetR family transcriptional regulator [Propionibacterium australiense]SYZ33008.1 Homeobox domain-like [Propionibacterium australiense]VEH92253.1 Bacterial regulatory proteins, tetR family [Propionibacterium australiense]
MTQGDVSPLTRVVTHDTPGRPRDPLVEPRALTAALEIYGQHGWSGFTMGRVTMLAKVGKSSIYRRWPDRVELLTAAFERTALLFELDDSRVAGLPFQEQLLTMVQHRLYTYTTPTGTAIIRLQVEHHCGPDEVGDIWKSTLSRFRNGLRTLLSDAHVTSHLRPGASPELLAEALEGSMIMQALAVPFPTVSTANVSEQSFALVKQVVAPWLTDPMTIPATAHPLPPIISASTPSR